MDSVLEIFDKEAAKIRTCKSFLDELKFIFDCILITPNSSFLEAKKDCYIHYILNDIECLQYFGTVINNYFYFGATKVAKIEKDEVSIINNDYFEELTIN